MGRNMRPAEFYRVVERAGGRVVLAGGKVSFLAPDGRLAHRAHLPHKGTDGRWVECMLKSMRRAGWDLTSMVAA